MTVRTQIPGQGSAFGRYASHAIGILVGLSLAACFPKLPPEDDARDGATTEDGTGSGDTTTPPGDTATPPDTTPGTDMIVAIDVPPSECESAADCEALAGVCQAAACEEKRCIVTARADTTVCDDGNLCTEADACTAGVCAGTPKTCAATSQCHLVGTCDASTGKCSTPAKLDGTACDDGNQCTVLDTCRLGICTGAGKPPRDKDIAMALVAAPGSVAFVEAVAGNAELAWAATYLTGPDIAWWSEYHELQPMRTENPLHCELVLARFRTSSLNATIVPFASSATPCPRMMGATATGGMVSLPDSGVALLGFTTRPMALASGRERLLGESPSGLAYESAFYLARFAPSGALLWTLEFLGVFGQYDPSTEAGALSVNESGTMAAAILLKAGAAHEVVVPDGSTRTLSAVGEIVGSILIKVGLNGDYSEVAVLDAPPGGAGIFATVVDDDSAIGVAGVVGGGVLSIRDAVGVETQIATGLDYEMAEAWAAWFDSDGGFSWGRHIFVDPAFPIGENNGVKVTTTGTIDKDGTVWFAFSSWGPLVSRVSNGEATPILASAWPSAPGYRTTLVGFDKVTGAIRASKLLDSTEHHISALTSIADRLYVAGAWQGSYTHGARSPMDAEYMTPYVAAASGWFSQLASPTMVAPHEFLESSDFSFGPKLSRAGASLFTGFNLSGSAAVVTRISGVEVEIQDGGSAAVFRRMNTDGALDCE